MSSDRVQVPAASVTCAVSSAWPRPSAGAPHARMAANAKLRPRVISRSYAARRYLRYARVVRALVLLLVVSCGRGAPTERRGVAIGTPRKAEVTALSPEGSMPVVTLLDAGREPRRQLRYHPAVGVTQRVKTSQTSRSELHPFVNGEVKSTIELTVS